MAVSTKQILSAAIVTGPGSPSVLRKANATFHASGTTSAGSGTATVKIEGSNDGGATWKVIATLTLVLETTLSAGTADGVTTNAPWGLVWANVTAIAGTDASVNCYLGE